MSRHELTSKNPDIVEAAGGWDGPLDTFFYQETRTVIIDDEQADDTNFIIGGVPGHCKDVDVFLETLEVHAEIPLGFREQLLEDREQMPHDAKRPAYVFGLVTPPS